jgi:hypothetical protein
MAADAGIDRKFSVSYRSNFDRRNTAGGHRPSG